MTVPGSRSWRGLVLTGLTAAAVCAAIDLLVARAVDYPPPMREVEDAVRDYASSDPTTLVIGSSHARSFDSLAALVRRRDPSGERLLAVPLEFGKLASYEWVFKRRLWPLADERLPDGNRRRPSLRRVILVTEWWDSCDTDDGGPSSNLPARAWTFSDFAADARGHGLTVYNQNYVHNRWHELWEPSVIMRDRGLERLVPLLRARVFPVSAERRERGLQLQTEHWQRLVEGGTRCMGAPSQMEALDSMLADFERRGLDVTILLYPRKPGTLTDKAKATTLPDFSAMMGAIAQRRGIRFIDMTSTSPLRDDEFADDFDHVTPSGNQRFAEWALDGSLHWLLENGDSVPTPAGTRS